METTAKQPNPAQRPAKELAREFYEKEEKKSRLSGWILIVWVLFLLASLFTGNKYSWAGTILVTVVWGWVTVDKVSDGRMARLWAMEDARESAAKSAEIKSARRERRAGTGSQEPDGGETGE